MTGLELIPVAFLASVGFLRSEYTAHKRRTAEGRYNDARAAQNSLQELVRHCEENDIKLASIAPIAVHVHRIYDNLSSDDAEQRKIDNDFEQASLDERGRLHITIISPEED